MRTRADMLRFAIAFALIKARKVVRGLRQGLTEEECYAVADAVVCRCRSPLSMVAFNPARLVRANLLASSNAHRGLGRRR